MKRKMRPNKNCIVGIVDFYKAVLHGKEWNNDG